MINRPRNRQPRPPRSNNQNFQQRNNNPPLSNVPTTAQVQPGASVSIVLKADQPTGREVQGIVQDLLTRGNHPRGIKVRLRDGRIGRVQRMVMVSAMMEDSSVVPKDGMTTLRPVRREGLDGFARSTTPLSSSAGVGTGSVSPIRASSPQEDVFQSSTPTVRCPICGDFEGDEAAVSHHVQQHLD